MNKFISRGVALLLLAGALVACGTDKDSEKQTDASTTDSESVSVTETETAKPSHYEAKVPAADFKEKVFKVADISPDTYDILYGFDFETDSADVVETAIFQRNRDIEEQFNMRFEHKYYATWDATIPVLQNQATSDTDDFQLIMMINREAFSAAVAGYIMPYENIPYVDLSNPWYMKHVNEMLTIGGETVVAYSEECLNAYLQNSCVFFNKQVVADLDLEDPYELVRDGKWTQDAFYSMAVEAIYDVDGGGKFSHKDGDRYGVVTEADFFFPSMWVGSGINTIEKDENDMPVYTAPGNNTLIEAITTLGQYVDRDGFYLDSFTANFNGGGEPARTGGTQYFAEGHALFRYGIVGNVEALRDMKADFGILPTPKYDESQDRYYGRMIDGWVHVAPTSVQDLELLGTMMEALGAESMNYVRPAYFEKALGSKLTRDPDSEEMLNLIFDNITLDLGDTAWAGYVRGPLNDHIVKNGGNNLVSYLTSLENSTNTLIADTLEAMQNRE